MSKLSIILPAYNAEKFIEKAINSVKNQKYSDWELLIVDDGSKDNTGRILNEIASSDNRIKVIHQENQGQSVSRNMALDMASGEYIAFVDADDYINEDIYVKLIGEIETNNADIACCGYTSVSDENIYLQNPNEHTPLPSGLYSKEVIEEKIIKELLEGRLKENLFRGTVWRFVFKKSIIDENNIRFSGIYLEDEIFLLEYFSNANSLVCVDEGLYNYYLHEGSITRSYIKDFTNIYEQSIVRKEEIVKKYNILVCENWIDINAWAGLLAAVGIEFSKENAVSTKDHINNLKNMCAIPMIEHAIKTYVPKGMNKRKMLISYLVRYRCFGIIALLYRIKNK